MKRQVACRESSVALGPSESLSVRFSLLALEAGAVLAGECIMVDKPVKALCGLNGLLHSLA